MPEMSPAVTSTVYAPGDSVAPDLAGMMLAGLDGR